MIVAGFLLLAVGAADLVRQFAPRRWIGYLSAAVALLLLGSVSGALLPMLAGLAAGAAWVWLMPEGRRASPAGFWPAIALAAISIGAVAWLGARADAGLIGEVWTLRSPFGEVPFDLALLVVGLGVFLLESGNLVVRAALDGEHTWRPSDAEAAVSAAADAEPAGPDAQPAAAPAERREGFKGGRLIGPLERVLVFLLTLAGAYPVLAAMLAAKGIVRFPEISRDGDRRPCRVLPGGQPRQLGDRAGGGVPGLVGGVQLMPRSPLIAWSACLILI